MSTAEIKRRFDAMEREIADLKARQSHSKDRRHPVQTLESIHGTFEDDPAFREATRLGRKWRAGHRPNRAKSKAARR